MGFLNLKHLTKKVVSQNYKLTDSIDKIIFKQYRCVNEDTIMGLASRILEIDEFLAVKNISGGLVGIITHMQLLDFISSGMKSCISGMKSLTCESEKVTNGLSS